MRNPSLKHNTLSIRVYVDHIEARTLAVMSLQSSTYYMHVTADFTIEISQRIGVLKICH